MGVEAVIATQVIDTTSVGRSLMTAADAAAARAVLSLGTLATQNGTISDYLTAATAASTYQVTLVSATNIKTVNGSTLLGSGDLAISGLSGTGSVDNAALRADGSGGATLQNSAWIIADNATASPNNTVNHACLEATGGTTNVSVSIKPKGTGAFCLHVPDGTGTGGNVRGANAVDLQLQTNAATQVVSGDQSAIIGGGYNSNSGTYAFIGAGQSNNVSAYYAGCLAGYGNTVSGSRSATVASYSCTVSGTSAAAIAAESSSATTFFALVSGESASATRYGMRAAASGQFASAGDAQYVRFVLRRKTTNATLTTLLLDGSSTRLTIPSGKVASLMCRICGIKSDGSAVANYVRRVVIKNVGGTTSLVGTVETIGTDIEDSAACDVAITADDANDALQINVTGITAETWRWVAVVEGLEIAYGT